jgi:glycosyltransferase involved in cell wall biosynthesis
MPELAPTRQGSGSSSSDAKLPRLAIIVSHPIQHFCPMYRDIARTGRVELLVIFAQAGAEPRFDPGFGRVISWQDDLLENVPHVKLQASDDERSKTVLAELDKFDPAVIYVHGYARDYLRAAMKWANNRGKPVLMTTDSELRTPRPLHKRVAKRIVLPPVLRSVDMFLTVGDENERYFSHYGVPRERFHRVPFSIDSAYYDKVLTDQKKVRDDLRKELGIPDDMLAALTVGKLIPRKQQADLVGAFAKLKESGRSAVMLIAGDGPDRQMLTEMAKPLGDMIRFLGFVGVQDLPRYYSAADVYIHPSSEDPHPLAISEAAYCGLPIVVSDRIGSIGPTDDVQEGVTGWVYPLGDTGALAKVLENLIDHPDVRAKAGIAARPLGQLHASDKAAAQFVEGALKALERRNAGKQ